MGIQIIKTPTGEELVVLPKSEYDALVSALEEAAEDLADIAAYDSAKASFSSADILPAEVSAYITNGEGRVAAFRHWRGLSQQDLAARAGVTLDALVELEHGDVVLTEDVASMLRKALELPDNWLRP